MSLFRTPALQEFWLTWYIPPSQLQDVGEEFLSQRLIEDIADGNNSLVLVILGVQMPDDRAMRNHRVGSDIAVQFKVLCTQDAARDLIGLGYKLQDQDEPEGMTWGDFTSILRGTLPQSDKEAWDKQVRATDDNDPHAPWFRVMGIKHDDEGIFLAIEEIEP